MCASEGERRACCHNARWREHAPEKLETTLAAGGTVVLSGNITIDNASKSFTIQNAVTLDLNGFPSLPRATAAANCLPLKTNGSLTLNDSRGTGAL